MIWGGFYALIVIGFTEFYYRKWNWSPDSFIIHQELNLFPISSVAELSQRQGENIKRVEIPQLSTLQADLNLLLKEIDNENTKISALKKRYEDLDREFNEFFEKYIEIRDENIRNFKVKEINELESQIDDVDLEITKIESIAESIPKSSLYTYGYDVAIAQLKVDLANLELERANKNMEISSTIVEEFERFGDEGISQKLDVIRDSRSDISARMDESQIRISQAQENLDKSLDLWRSARVSALSRIDFFYYSIGISTTTTFGDIVANSHLVRLAVSVQLVLSVITVACFTNALLSEKQQPDQS